MRSETIDLKSLREELDRRQRGELSPQATPNAAALRREHEPFLEEGWRQAFSVDSDRILHSLAYARYIDKTQVFYLVRNDHITHRVLHVQLVSKISRTIGRFLGLNEDLIEAVALGHDIGHTPFGHDGERFLSELCREHGIGAFQHNVQSVQFLDRVERKGRGWNLTLQTLDGILCHDGEVHSEELAPQRGKSFATLAEEIRAKKETPDFELVPMTLEGCVVRMADTIAYIGRDIEDAIRLGLIRREELPQACTRVLGETNGRIVFTLTSDLVLMSRGRPSVRFSPEVSRALKALKEFNLERIYLNPAVKPYTARIRDLFRLLFSRYLDDLERGREESVLFRGYLHGMDARYAAEHRPAEIVRDFIAGMTDRYFLEQCPPELRPAPVECAGRI